MNYYIEVEKPKQNNAGSKAPDDISKICKNLGMKKFAMPPFPKERGKIYQKTWLLIVGFLKWIELLIKLKTNDRVIFQYPMYGNFISIIMIPLIQRLKGVNFTAVIHDIESLRLGIGNLFTVNERTKRQDTTLLSKFNFIISHNSSMTEYLKKQGISQDKIVELGIFDYLLDEDYYDSNKINDNSVVVAGILAPEKSGYLYELMNNKSQRLKLNLFGPGFIESQKADGINYWGSFAPDELPAKLRGSFGIVWDGPSIETCEGNTGNYLRYNNPHKTSLFCASNIPIITWKEAAIASFIEENRIGITVNSLSEVANIIENLSQDEYELMNRNMSEISEKVRNGYFFTTAVEKCFS